MNLQKDNSGNRGRFVMKEFDKWYNNIEKEYPLYQDKDGYNIGNIRALKVGWKAACEHWLQVAKDHDQEMEFMIEDELEE